jgi:hypothetical protein
MTSTTQHLPVILLLGKRRPNHDEVDAWLAKCPYSTCEATDVFQALEEISDFTVGASPDVVFLHVDTLQKELEMLESMLDTSAGNVHASVIAFPGQDQRPDGSLHALAQQLERLIPDGPHAAV